MKKSILFIPLLLLSACGGLNLSPNENPNVIPKDYNSLLENREVKKITYDCKFDVKQFAYPRCSFVEKCNDNDTSCIKVSDIDYVSFFVSYNFQGVEILASDYIMNLAKSLDKDKKDIQKEYISELFNPTKRSFYDEDTKNLLFQKMVFTNMAPSSFATKIDDDISIFLSKKDIFLRNTIYPSLKLTGIKKDIGNQYLSETYLQYYIYPHAFDVHYTTDWMAAYLGAPIQSKNEDNLNGVIEYFNTLTKNKDKIEDHSTEKLLDSEKARAFVFEDKIREAEKNNTSNALMPMLPGEYDGFLNEYLPKYTLEKIEIVSKFGNEEKILKSFDKSAIAELLISNEEIAGFAYRAEKVADKTISVRFIHIAEAPRYEYPGLLKARASGLEDIYNKLRKVMITDLDISAPYDLKSIPVDCIEKVKVADILTSKGISDVEKDKYLSLFKNKSTECISYEEFMTKVIFSRDFR